MQRERLAIGADVFAVRVEAAREALAALLDLLGQGALDDAQPVRVGQHLVGRVDHGHRILQVEDGGERGLEHQVGHAGRIGLADGGRAVDAQVEVDAVVPEQHRRRRGGIALVADERGRVLESGAAAVQRDDQRAVLHGIGSGVLVRAVDQGRGLVEHVAREGDDLGATHRVVARALLGALGLGDGVGAIERVVERTPARVGGIERIARVEDRHHQLRAGLQGQLGVDVGGGGLHVGRLRQQVADLLQVRAIGGHVGDRAGIELVPGVELDLQAVALGQQRGVLGGQVGHDGVETLPERGAVDAGGRQHPVLDEAMEFVGDLEAVDGGAIGHGNLVE